MDGDAQARIEELEAALVRQTNLLREVDHRVKNTLQLISSLMLLQTRRITDETARLSLRSMLERVNAVSTVHRQLFQGDEKQQFNVAAFLRDLAGDLALANGRADVEIRLDLQPAVIPAAAAAPFALVASELISNALKHAFPDRPGVVEITVGEAGGTCELSIADNGQGMDGAPKGFGLTIVGLLCQQLHAELEMGPGHPGVRAVVRTPSAAASGH